MPGRGQGRRSARRHAPPPRWSRTATGRPRHRRAPSPTCCRRWPRGGWTIRCVATSPATERAARALGHRRRAVRRGSTASTSRSTAPTRSIPTGWLVKGGGGAHTREKVVAAAAERFVVIVSSDKAVERLGPPIPLELLAFGLDATLAALGGACACATSPPSPDGGADRRLPRAVRGPARARRAPGRDARRRSATGSSRRR